MATYIPQELFIFFKDNAPTEEITKIDDQLRSLVGHGKLLKYDGRYTDLNLSDAYTFLYFRCQEEDPYLYARVIASGCVKEVSTLDDLIVSNLTRRLI